MESSPWGRKGCGREKQAEADDRFGHAWPKGVESIGDAEPPSTGGSLAAMGAVRLAVGIAGTTLTAYQATAVNQQFSRA